MGELSPETEAAIDQVLPGLLEPQVPVDIQGGVHRDPVLEAQDKQR